MKHYGTYSCGHDGTIDIWGTSKEREWKIERSFSGLCPKCYEKKMQEDRAKALSNAQERALELGFPELEGTEKQCAWAMTLRDDFLHFSEAIAEKAVKRKWPFPVADSLVYLGHGEILNAVHLCCISHIAARFWIDSRDDEMKTLYLAIKEYVRHKKDEPFKDALREIKEEKERINLTVRPDGAHKEGSVRFEQDEEGNLIAAYPKDDDFIEIVKSKGLIWYNRSRNWRKLRTEFSSINNCAAELGNALLARGFTVEFMNTAQRDAALAGNFNPEKRHWVKYAVNKEQLVICWHGKNDELYEAAKRLSNARWSKENQGVLVPVEFYRQVEDFAEIYDFGFSDGAKDAIGKYKKKQAGFLSAAVTEQAVDYETSAGERLREQLESGGTIIEDLKDDA